MLNIQKPILKPSQKATLLFILKKNDLYTLLNKYESLFNSNLCICNGKPCAIKIKPNAEPYHRKYFPVPHIHEIIFKQELDQIEALKVKNKVNQPQWGAPTFLIPKKEITVRFISNFRELNKRILREHIPYLGSNISYWYLKNFGLEPH